MPTAPPQVDPLVGRLLDGRYQIVARLAEGGMAVVYRALDVRLDRPVAVKVMHPAFAADDGFVTRFRREAKAAASLSSPHVVAVTDQGRDGEAVFLVMELVDGRTLRDLLREQGRLSVPAALAVLEPVLEALAAAHRAGLVHRDVKPENVLVDRACAAALTVGTLRGAAELAPGAVKVADFGLARAVDASPLTATTGVLLGTVAYLAPEQISGQADARADVYAAGVLLFELVTGRVPFDGASPLQVAYRHLHEDVPPPSRLRPDLPPGVAEIVDGLVAAATARDPEQRPRDALELLARVRLAAARLPDAAAESGPTAVTDPLPVELPPQPTGTSGDGHRTSQLPVDAPTEPPRKRRRPSRRTVLALVAVLALAAGLVSWRVVDRGVAVPRVVGLSPVAATDALQRVHLRARVAPAGLYSETIPKGAVAATDPAVGQDADPDQPVELRLSLGPERYTVPTLHGLPLDQARGALTVAHLVVGKIDHAYDDEVPAEAVVSSTPAAGSVQRPGTAVDLVLSQGPAPVDAPDVSGQDAAAAQQTLESLGLVVNRDDEFSDSVPLGKVIGLNPNTGLHRRQQVTLQVSKGPQLIAVPGGLYQMSPRQARALLESLGFKVNVLSFPGFDGSVARVVPGPGTLLRHGATVTLLLV